jgi:opacity protein-like surface antigen
MLRVGVLTLAAALVAAAPAAAQDEKPLQINVGGGFTGIYGAASDRIGNGGGFNVGAIYKVNPLIALQGEYSWNGMKKKNLQLPVFATPASTDSVPTDFFADGNMQYGDFNVLVSPKVEGRLAPYGITGIGVYYRPVNVTTPGIGFVTVCDPYWYVCFPDAVAVDQVVGSRSSTDFGMNFGGGVTTKLTDHTSLYFEIRYHYIWGPTVSTPTQSLKANGKFLPITVGVRF